MAHSIQDFKTALQGGGARPNLFEVTIPGTIPGSNNGIKYGNNTISNWWDLLYNWDDAVKGKKKLFE